MLELILQAQMSRLTVFFVTVSRHLFSHTPVAGFTRRCFQKSHLKKHFLSTCTIPA